LGQTTDHRRGDDADFKNHLPGPENGKSIRFPE
jgi:hypothetical protein